MMLNFKFFVGVVEDTYDPLKINRVRVRCVGVHPESRSEVGTADLPWAPMLSTTANMSAPMLHNGDWVFGFFMDGEEAQQPVVIGSIVSKPTAPANAEKGFNDPDGFWPQYVGEGTNSRLARNENVDDQTPIGKRKLTRIPSVTTADRRRWQEPETQYAAAYPMNKVLETESGHVLEFDDTPGRERVHIYHKSGAFMEMYPDGKVLYKSVNNTYQMTLGEHDVYASGAVNISAAGKVNVLANDGVNISSRGDINLRGKNVTIEARESVNIAGGNSLVASSGGKATIQASRDIGFSSTGGAMTLAATAPISLASTRINVSSSINLSRTPRARAPSVDIRSREEPEVETYAHQRQDRVDRYRVTPTSAALEQPPAGGWPEVNTGANLPTPTTPPAPQPVSPPQPTPPDLECGSPPAKNSGLYLTLAGDPTAALSQLRAHPNWQDAFRRGMDLIKQFEGFEANMYLDSVGVATIGWGFTDVALRAVRNDPRVANLAFFRSTYNGQLARGMSISRADADVILDVMVETIYMRSVLSSGSGVAGANVTPYMVMALTSFTFNLGAGNLQRSTLRRLTRETNAGTPPETYATISQQFMQWTKAGGQVLRGLVRRRQAEKCLFVFAG